MNEKNQKIFKILVWISVFVFAIVGIALAIYSNSNPKVTQTEWKQMLSESFGDKTLLKITEEGEYLTGKYAAKTAVYALGDEKVEYLKNYIQEPEYDFLDLALEFDIIKKSEFNNELNFKEAKNIINKALELEFSPEYYPEYCNIDYKENVTDIDFEDVVKYDAEQEVIEFIGADALKTGELITFTDKYGVKDIRRITAIKTTEKNTNIAELEKIQDLSEVADSISFSGNGDFSYLTGNESKQVESKKSPNLMVKNRFIANNNTLAISMGKFTTSPAETDWYWDKKQDIISKKETAPVDKCDLTLDFEINNKKEGTIKATVKKEGSEVCKVYKYSTKKDNQDKLDTITDGEEQPVKNEETIEQRKKVAIKSNLSMGAKVTIKGLAVSTSGYIDLNDFENQENYIEAYVSADNVILSSSIKTTTDIKQLIFEAPVPVAALGGSVCVNLKLYLVVTVTGEVSLLYEIESPKVGVGYSHDRSLYFVKNAGKTDSDVKAKVEISGGALIETSIEVFKFKVVNPSIDLRVKGSIATVDVLDGYEKKPGYEYEDCIELKLRAPIIKFSALTGEDTILYKILKKVNVTRSVTIDLMNDTDALVKITYHVESDSGSGFTSKKLKYHDGKHDEKVCTRIQKIEELPVIDESDDDSIINNTEGDSITDGPIEKIETEIDAELQEQEDKIMAVITAKIEEIVVRIIDEMFAEACS